MSRWTWLSSKWFWAGAAAALLIPFLILITSPCDGAEAVFGITILGAFIGGVVGGTTRWLFERTSAFLIGIAMGFAAAFVLIFFVLVQFIPEC